MYEPVHVLSKQSARQRRNVFIWCTEVHKVALGWRVDNDSPVTVATAHRWVTNAVQTQLQKGDPIWEEASSYALFPVVVQPTDVLRYSVRKSGGGALSRESQDIMEHGDYGLYPTRDGGEPRLYYFFWKTFSFSDTDRINRINFPSLRTKTSLTPNTARQALERDRRCPFSGVMPNRDSDSLVATWVFPPFLGFKLSDDSSLEHKYYNDPDSCNINQYMVVTNVISGRKVFIDLFWENKLGIDVDNNYRLVMFEPECRKDIPSLKTHATLSDGPLRPSDDFLRLHFNMCLAVRVCLGDVREDYEDQEIETFMEGLGIFDDEVDPHDPQWQTPLGMQVHAYLLREKMRNLGDDYLTTDTEY